MEPCRTWQSFWLASDHRPYLTGNECTQIITLWQVLGEYAINKLGAPGVEGTKRYFIGGRSRAQWPDCNRVVEAIITKLCAIYPDALCRDGVKVSRFVIVTCAYMHIRECIINNAKVMRETTIQLPEVNASRVAQWFSWHCKSQEEETLEQGIPAPDAPMAEPETLPYSMQKGPTLPSGNFTKPYLLVLPPNTAGNATLMGRLQPQSISQVPPPPCQLRPVIAPPPPVSFPFILTSVSLPTVPGPSLVMAAPGPSQVMATPGASQVMFYNLPLPPALPPSTQTSSQDVPYSTQRYRKKQQERMLSGHCKRKYTKKTHVVLCRKCNKVRKPPSHNVLLSPTNQ